ncbi:hypothetical protein BDR05DRAFT_955524 [Suillus weaverae]|nr:hypothetical protein BDR05DRAFT_955524 [Suillus weaverae]
MTHASGDLDDAWMVHRGEGLLCPCSCVSFAKVRECMHVSPRTYKWSQLSVLAWQPLDTWQVNFLMGTWLALFTSGRMTYIIGMFR